MAKKAKKTNRVVSAVKVRLFPVLCLFAAFMIAYGVCYFAPSVIINLVDRGYEEVAESTLPTVVHIRCTPANSSYGSRQGSGVIVSANGMILTAGHVIADGQATYTVTLNDGQVFTTQRACRLKNWDVGFLRISAANLPFSTFANSDNVEVGAKLMAVGSPFGIDNFNSVTLGILSAKNRESEYPGWSVLLQADTPANPGNSGCPVFTVDKKIAGIVVGSCTRVYAGIVYCIPSNVCSTYVDSARFVFEMSEFERDREEYNEIYSHIDGIKSLINQLENIMDENDTKISDLQETIDKLKNMIERLSRPVLITPRKIEVDPDFEIPCMPED